MNAAVSILFLAAVLGVIADHKGVEYVYQLCAWMPVIGLLTVFLPPSAEMAELRGR